MKYIPSKSEIIGMKLILYRHYDENGIDEMTDDEVSKEYYHLFGRIRLSGVNHNVWVDPKEIPLNGVKYDDYMEQLGLTQTNKQLTTNERRIL